MKKGTSCCMAFLLLSSSVLGFAPTATRSTRSQQPSLHESVQTYANEEEEFIAPAINMNPPLPSTPEVDMTLSTATAEKTPQTTKQSGVVVSGTESFQQKMGIMRADSYQTWLPADINAPNYERVINNARYTKSVVDDTTYQSPYGMIYDPSNTNTLSPDHGNK